MIIFRVTHSDNIVRRDMHQLKRRQQSASLVDAGRQDHDRPLVEDDLQFQPQFSNGVEDRSLVGLPGRHDDAADGNRSDVSIVQCLQEALRRWVG